MQNLETIKRLKKLPRARCFKCKKFKQNQNPLAKCHGCGEKFCFDHITCGQTFPGMRNTDEYVDKCQACLLRA
jgi:hypothetical protein